MARKPPNPLVLTGSSAGGGAPTGAAGGDLSGTYPNPSVQDDSHAHTAATLPATMPPSAHTHNGDALGTLTQLVVDNLDVNGNKIASLSGDIDLDPAGAGNVNVISGHVVVADATEWRWSDLLIARLAGPVLQIMNLAKDTYRSVRARAFEAHNGTTLKTALDPANSIPGVHVGTEGGVAWWNSTSPYSGAITAFLRAGDGSPEGAITANVGSVWLRTNGGAATSLYIKESGTGNTGWKALVGV